MSVSISPKIINDGLVFYIDPCNQKSYDNIGNDILDLSKNMYDFTKNVGMSFSSNNKGVFYYGVSDSYIVSDDQYGLSNDNTINIWVMNSKNASLTQSFFSDGGESNTQGFVWLYRNSNSDNLTFKYSNGVSSVSIDAIDYFKNNDNLWVYMSVSFEFATRIVRIYRNGVLYSQNTMDVGAIVPRVLNKYIGSYNTSSNFLKGYIGAVNLYNRILTNAEILINFNAFKSRYGL